MYFERFVLLCGTLFMCLTARTQPPQIPTDSAALWAEMTKVDANLWSDFPIAFKRARELHDFILTSRCTGCIPRAQLILGKCYWADGYYPEGEALLHRSAAAAKRSGDLRIHADAVLLLGMSHYYQAYYDSAIVYFNKAYDVKEQLADSSGMIEVLHDISLMYNRQGNFKKSLEYLFREESLKARFPEGVHDVEALEQGNLIIDSIYYREHIIKEERDLARYREAHDTTMIQRTYANLAQANRKLDEHLKAARYYVKSCEEQVKLGLLPTWIMAAESYADAGLRDSSLYYYYKAKDIIPRNTRPSNVWLVELLGDCHHKFNDLDSALLYYDSALSWNSSMNNRITVAGIHAQLVAVHTKLKRYDDAERHLRLGLSLAKKVALLHERRLYINARRLYEALGDYRQAIAYADRYTVLQDSINKADIAYDLTRVQAEFKTAQKDEDLRSMGQQNLLNEARIRTRNLQIALAIAFLVVAGGAGALYYSRYRQKKKAHDQLESKNAIIEQQNENLQTQNKEKEALLHEIHHRVKNNLQIISSLISLRTRHSSDETMLALQQLNGRILAMGLIHEKLYQSENVQIVRMDDYLTDLAHHVLQSFDAHPVHLDSTCEAVEIPAEAALTCGLINNELITNSIKYAFPGKQQDRKITLSVKRSNGTILMSIADNGRNGAIPVDQIRHSFGLRFVDQLVRNKLKGEWAIKIEDGFRVEIAFPA
jgi:two-component system, sensor histidine kinase PdtaS